MPERIYTSRNSFRLLNLSHSTIPTPIYTSRNSFRLLNYGNDQINRRIYTSRNSFRLLNDTENEKKAQSTQVEILLGYLTQIRTYLSRRYLHK